jgi:adenylate kinase
MGPPGSGKGTQGARLAEHLGVEHIAVGDLLREEVENGTALGREVADTMARGDLIPDEVITRLLRPHIERGVADGGYILDGYPRTLTQAVAARQEADTVNVEADVVVWLDVDPDTLIARLKDRADQEDRQDDTVETISRRLQVYEEATRPLLDYYAGRGLLATVDASPGEDEVFQRVLAAVERRRPG